MVNIKPTLCGRSHIHIPDVGCSDCDRALYLIEQLSERVDSMRFEGYRGTYTGEGEVSSIPINIADYTYDANDTFLVIINGLNLVNSEFAITGSGSMVTVTLTDSIVMQNGDVVEVIALKFISS